MGKRLPAAATRDIVTTSPEKSEVGALALITLSPEKYAAEVFQPFKARLTAAIEGVKAIDYDIKTTAGMAAAVTARATFRVLRVDAEKERKARKAPIISIGNLLESGYNNLEARITPIEEMFDGDIQEEVKRKAEEKAEKERIEAVRIAAIRAKIAEISSLPAKHARATAAQLTDALRELATREIMNEEFAEQTDDARAAVDTAAAELIALRDAATASEAAALAAEEARKAEAQRAADEAAAVAAQRAENERVANALAIAAKRLADQEAAQALVAKQLADKAAANLKADRDAQELAMRLEREKSAKEQAERDRVAADTKRQLDEQQAQIAADRKAFEDEQAAAAQQYLDHLAAELLRQQIPVDHAEGLEMNAVLDAAIARIEPVEKFTSDDLARCNATVASLLADNLPPPESCCARDARINEGFDETPTDGEILDVYVENFGGTREQAIERLAQFDAVAAQVDLPLPGGQHYSTTTFKDNGEPILLNADGSRSIFCDLCD